MPVKQEKYNIMSPDSESDFVNATTFHCRFTGSVMVESTEMSASKLQIEMKKEHQSAGCILNGHLEHWSGYSAFIPNQLRPLKISS